MNTVSDYLSWSYPDHDSLTVRRYNDGGKLLPVDESLASIADTIENVLNLPPGRYRVECRKDGKAVQNGSKSVTIPDVDALPGLTSLAETAAIFRAAQEAGIRVYADTLRFTADVVKSFPRSLAAMADMVTVSSAETAEVRKELNECRAKFALAKAEAANGSETMAVLGKFIDTVGAGNVTPEKVAEVFAKIPAAQQTDAAIRLYLAMPESNRANIAVLFISLAAKHDTEQLKELVANNPALLAGLMQSLA